MRSIAIGLLLFLFALPSAGCDRNPRDIPIFSYEVVNIFPHDFNAFTQGLVFHNGALFESTGLRGGSSLRKVDLESGDVLKKIDIPSRYFAEGLTVLDNKLFQLTWQSNTGFIYDIESFELKDKFSYSGEGWGLTTDGRSLIMSDGTRKILFLNPRNFEVERTINVYDCGKPPLRLNELEYVKGEIYANIYERDRVARIDPISGEILGYIDFAGLLLPQDYSEDTGVLNGIAYDATNDRLFVTGKLWPELFEVRLKQKHSQLEN